MSESEEQSSVLSIEEDHYSDINGSGVDNILPYSYEPDDSETSSNSDNDNLDNEHPERFDSLDQW